MRREILECLVIRYIAVAVLVLIAPITTSGQDERYIAQVRRQLSIVKVAIEDNGFEKTHDYKIDKLRNKGTNSFTLTLRKGISYILVSACDKDCSDLDIKVYDENDNQVASDTKVDDLPVVRVTPKWTGQFRFKVTMYKCNNNICYYGIGVFGK